jgi:hypothetical protein
MSLAFNLLLGDMQARAQQRTLPEGVSQSTQEEYGGQTEVE